MDKYIHIRLSEDEYWVLKKTCAENRTTIQEYIRSMIYIPMDKPVEISSAAENSQELGKGK
jgi:predicted DNA binding CopG/RHH family protein